jgi:hypothetical protein
VHFSRQQEEVRKERRKKRENLKMKIKLNNMKEKQHAQKKRNKLRQENYFKLSQHSDNH